MARSKKILIVEEHMDSRDMLALFFQHEGYNVTIAADGQEALDLALQQQPDLILTALMLPVIDGVEMIQRLRKEPNFDKVPIVVVTSYAERIPLALKAGANAAVQ